MAEVNIHEITSYDASAIHFIKASMAALKWHLGMQDVDCYLASDHPGIYIGELNGTPIATVSFTKYCSTYYSFGLYIVDEKYRGKGYGMQIFNTTIQQIDSSQNISTYSVVDMAKKYEIHGFRQQWVCQEYEINLSKALEILKATAFHQNGLTAKNISDIHQEALVDYDTVVFGYQRHNFLIKWLHAKGSHIKVVVNGEGTIMGYAVVRVLFRQHEDYVLGPLFAESDDAARVLLRALFDKIINKGISSSQSVFVYCPAERNPTSAQMMKELHGKHTGKENDLVYMTTKGIPRGCFDKWYGVTTPSI